jgi:hypothetical protein
MSLVGPDESVGEVVFMVVPIGFGSTASGAATLQKNMAVPTNRSNPGPLNELRT